MRFWEVLSGETELWLTSNTFMPCKHSKHLAVVSQSDTCTHSFSYGVNCTFKGLLTPEYGVCAYKFKKEGVLSERSNTASKAQDEHDPSHHDEEPHWVETPEICD